MTAALFVVSLTYLVELEVIDRALPDHIGWLDQQYADGVFILSGRRVPRTGGLILATNTDEEDLRTRLAQDPFAERGYARYEVIAVDRPRVAPGFDALQQAVSRTR
jgi:uncharacterized protein YciI